MSPLTGAGVCAATEASREPTIGAAATTPSIPIIATT
jgi:hypothetical protein